MKEEYRNNPVIPEQGQLIAIDRALTPLYIWIIVAYGYALTIANMPDKPSNFAERKPFKYGSIDRYFSIGLLVTLMKYRNEVTPRYMIGIEKPANTSLSFLISMAENAIKSMNMYSRSVETLFISEIYEFASHSSR